MFLAIWCPGKNRELHFALVNLIVTVFEVAALVAFFFRRDVERTTNLVAQFGEFERCYAVATCIFWASLSLALAALIIYAVDKKSHYFCKTWFVCEGMMLIFVTAVILYTLSQSSANSEKASRSYHLRVITPNTKVLALLHIFIKTYGLCVIGVHLEVLKQRIIVRTALFQASNIPSEIILSQTGVLNANEKSTSAENSAADSRAENLISSFTTTPHEVPIDCGHQNREEGRVFKESFNYQRL